MNNTHHESYHNDVFLIKEVKDFVRFCVNYFVSHLSMIK